MKSRAPCPWAHWCVHEIMFDLGSRSDHDDFVLKKCAIGIVGLPKFWIENFIERMRSERIRSGKANHMALQAARDVFAVADLAQSARGERLIDFLTRFGWQPGQLSICNAIVCSADLSVDWISPEIHEADAIIQEWRRRD